MNCVSPGNQARMQAYCSNKSSSVRRVCSFACSPMMAIVITVVISVGTTIAMITVAYFNSFP